MRSVPGGVVMNAFELMALLLSITGLALFVAAVHLRWFSRLRRGFLVTLMIAMVGTGLASSLLVGAWGYKSAKQIMAEETIKDMGWFGRLVEEELNGVIEKSLAQMSELSKILLPAIERGGLEEVQEDTFDFLRLNRRFIQINVYDKSGRLLTAASLENATESVNRVAVAFALEGRNFTSDPYLSTVFGKDVPLSLRSGAVSGRGGHRISEHAAGFV